MEVEFLPRRLLAPRDVERPHRPGGDAGPGLNGNPHLQQFRIVFITGIRSGILSRLDRSSMELDVRRAFTSVQLRTILEENRHSFLIVERRRTKGPGIWRAALPRP